MSEQLNCTESQQLIPWLLDDELDAAQRLILEEHLGQCGDCRAFLEHEGQLRLVVRRSAGSFIAPRSLQVRVRDTLDSSSSSRPRLQRFWPAAAAAAVLIGVLVQESGVGFGSDWEPLMRPHARNLPMDVVTPVHATVQSYLTGRLPFAVQLPRFKAKESSLLGGRVTHVENRDAAYVKYRLPSGELSVFVYEDRGLNIPAIEPLYRIRDRRIIMERVRGYSVARWRDKGIVYSVISDLPTGELKAILFKEMVTH